MYLLYIGEFFFYCVQIYITSSMRSIGGFPSHKKYLTVDYPKCVLPIVG